MAYIAFILSRDSKLRVEHRFSGAFLFQQETGFSR